MVDKIVILLFGWLGLFSLDLSADSNETKATIAQMRGGVGSGIRSHHTVSLLAK